MEKMRIFYQKNSHVFTAMSESCFDGGAVFVVVVFYSVVLFFLLFFLLIAFFKVSTKKLNFFPEEKIKSHKIYEVSKLLDS